VTTTAAHTPDRNCYMRGCRKPDCRRIATRYRKQLRIEHERGQRRLHDATQTRAHIQRLTTAGWTQVQIADAAGILSASIHKLHVGAQTRLTDWRAAAILAIEIGPPPADISRADATGSRRRLQALRVLGHRRYDLAARLNITPDRIKHITSGSTQKVSVEEAAAIARLYRQLCTVLGPSKQTATIARNEGWHGPLAWDDIDNPACEPETEHRPSRATNGARRKVHADPARVAHLTAVGKSAEQIARELGCHKRTVVRARGRARHLETAA
jgi:DNA-binding CsgD family transcriptional regulator